MIYVIFPDGDSVGPFDSKMEAALFVDSVYEADDARTARYVETLRERESAKSPNEVLLQAMDMTFGEKPDASPA